jgi:hypothetical protein
MKALAGRAARAGLALVLALLTLAVARWPPVHARVPWDVRALPLFPLALACAVVAALAGSAPRGSSRWPGPRRLLALVAAAVLALAAVVALRPAAGLPAEVLSAGTRVGELPAGAVQVSGPRLRSLPFVRRWTFRWEGPLRVERTGAYRLWATGRGRVEVRLDGRVVLAGEGDALRAGADTPIGAGQHALEVTLERVGAGPRLTLGWTRPDGTHETLPVRSLGAPVAAPWWWLTDALALLCAVAVGLLAWRLDWTRARPLPAPRPFTRGELGASLAGYAALFALMSWPLVTDPAHLGVMDRPDGRLNAWILAWDAHALRHAPSRLFDAPIFHPLPDALAFSENLLLPAIAVAPLQLGGPVLAYNGALALSMILSGLGAQLLARRVSGARLAAFAGGAIFAFGAHRWIRLAHLQSQVTVFLPLVLLAFDRFWQRRTLRRAAGIGLALGLQALSSIYMAAVAALAAAAAAVCALFGRLGRREALKLAGGVGLALLVAAPVARPYLRMRASQGMEWSAEDVARYATTLPSYAAAGTRLLGPVTQSRLDPERVQDTLFPGLVPLVLGLAGLAVAPRRYRAVALVGTLAAVVLSLGPQTAVYRFLYEHVVLVRGIRALSRLSLLPVLALCVLAALALARARWPWTLLALALALAESTNAPIRYARYDCPPAAARALARQDGAVVVLPAGEDDTRAMLDGVAHWRPLVNGDSGFVPRPYTRALELLAGGHGEETLRFLRAVGVTQVAGMEDGRIEAVPAGPVARVVAPAPGAATFWSAGAIGVDLQRPSRIARVTFEVDERPWIASPRVETSTDGVAWTAVAATASLADATLSLYADPRRAHGEVRFAPVVARFVRLDPSLPARPVVLGAAGPPLDEDPTAAGQR